MSQPTDFRPSFAMLLLAMLVAIPAAAQQPPAGQPAGRGGTPPPPPQNLQVLAKDIPRQELLATMRSFTEGLGVMCNFCHIAEPGHNDFASDEKTPKKTARVMMRMTTQINQTLGSGIGKPETEVTKVQCMTCHRGESMPKLPAAAAPQRP